MYVGKGISGVFAKEREMKLTAEILKQADVCKECLDWFNETFQGESEFTDVLKTTKEHSVDWYVWLLTHLPVEFLRYALENGINPNIKDEYGWTVLHHAANWGNTKVVKALIKAGADPNAKTNSGGIPLQWAASWGRAEVVKVLLKAGVNPNAKNKDGWAALHYAVCYGHAEVVNLLLEAGVDINAKNKDGLTALHLAAYHGYAGIVKILVKAGAQEDV